LEALDLAVVPRVFLAGDRLAAVLERCLALDALALGLLEPMLSVDQLARELGTAALERFDLGPACEQAPIGGLGRVQAACGPADLVGLPVDEHDARGQPAAGAG